MEICNLSALWLHPSPKKVTKKPRVSAACNLVTFVTRFLMFYGYVRVRVRVYVNTYIRVTWLHYYIYVTNIYIYNKGLRSFLPVTFGCNLWCNLLNKVTSLFIPQQSPKRPMTTHAQTAAHVSTTKTRHNGRAVGGVVNKPARKQLGGAGWLDQLLPAAKPVQPSQARSYRRPPNAGSCDGQRRGQTPSRPGLFPERCGWLSGRRGSCADATASAVWVMPAQRQREISGFFGFNPEQRIAGQHLIIIKLKELAVKFSKNRINVMASQHFKRRFLCAFDVVWLRAGIAKIYINRNLSAHRLCPQSPALDCVSVIRDIVTIGHTVNNYLAQFANYFRSGEISPIRAFSPTLPGAA